eukprot:2153776-Amphidinium_carterae.2
MDLRGPNAAMHYLPLASDGLHTSTKHPASEVKHCLALQGVSEPSANINANFLGKARKEKETEMNIIPSTNKPMASDVHKA